MWNSRSSNIKNLLKTNCPSLCCFFLFPRILLVSVALTVTNPFSVLFIDLPIGRINPGISGAAHTSRCSGHSGSSKQFSSSTSDSLSASQSSSLSFELSKSPFQLSQLSVWETLSGALSSSLSAGWRSILRIRQTFNIWVRPPANCFADTAGGNGDLSDNLNAAAVNCWKIDKDALTLSSVSEMDPTAVIWLFWARDSFCVVRRFWLPCHISKKSWTLAILFNFFSSTSLFDSKSVSDSDLSNMGSSSANIPLLARAYCVTTTFSRRVSPVVFDCLQPITSGPREKLASTPTPWGMIENMLRATLARSVYFECVSSCCRHHSTISRIQNVLLISIESEW